jgi:hypothetical protein
VFVSKSEVWWPLLVGKVFRHQNSVNVEFSVVRGELQKCGMFDEPAERRLTKG